MEAYTTKKTPHEVLTDFERFFVEAWNDAGSLAHPTPGTLMVQAQRRTLWDSGLGILVLLVLSILTGGLFFIGYMVYWLVFADKTYWAQVTATNAGSSTRVNLESNRPEWQGKLELWANALEPA
jgi:hypothetical protein